MCHYLHGVVSSMLLWLHVRLDGGWLFDQSSQCFMRGKVHFRCAHPNACGWGLECRLGNKEPLGNLMLTDPLNRFPQSLLSHKEQCHVAKSSPCDLLFVCFSWHARSFSCRCQATQTSRRTHRPVQHLRNRTLLTHFLFPRCLFVSMFCPNQLIKVNSQPLFLTLWVWHNHFQTRHGHAMMQNRPARFMPMWFQIKRLSEFILVTDR